MDPLWTPYLWTPYGPPMNPLLDPYGPPMDPIWTPYGPLGAAGYPIWTPNGSPPYAPPPPETELVVVVNNALELVAGYGVVYCTLSKTHTYNYTNSQLARPLLKWTPRFPIDPPMEPLCTRYKPPMDP